MNPLVLKRSALVAAVMEPSCQQELLASLPVDLALALKREIEFVVKQGWNQIEHVLPLLNDVQNEREHAATLSLEQLLGLSQKMPAVVFSRILAAAGLRENAFALAALDPAYADAVKQALQHAPTQSPKVAEVVTAWARSESVAQTELIHAAR